MNTVFNECLSAVTFCLPPRTRTPRHHDLEEHLRHKHNDYAAEHHHNQIHIDKASLLVRFLWVSCILPSLILARFRGCCCGSGEAGSESWSESGLVSAWTNFYIKACKIKAKRFERILWQLLWFFNVTLFVSYPSISYPWYNHNKYA